MIRAAYDKYYQDEKFVRVLPEGVPGNEVGRGQ